MSIYVGPASTTMLNLPMSPAWMWNHSGIPLHVPHNPNQILSPFLAYTDDLGSTLKENETLRSLSTYYGRVASYILAGGLVDEAGKAHCSESLPSRFGFYEVLNEMPHHLNISTYTVLFDMITNSIKEESLAAARACNLSRIDVVDKLQLVAIEQGEWRDAESARYFLKNVKKHRASPIAWHFYCKVNQSDNEIEYETFFEQIDTFVAQGLGPLAAILREESPETKIFVNEFGTMLPNDIDTDPYVRPYITRLQ